MLIAHIKRIKQRNIFIFLKNNLMDNSQTDELLTNVNMVGIGNSQIKKETTMNEEKGLSLSEALKLSKRVRRKGWHPFGYVLIDPQSTHIYDEKERNWRLSPEDVCADDWEEFMPVNYRVLWNNLRKQVEDLGTKRPFNNAAADLVSSVSRLVINLMNNLEQGASIPNSDD